MPISITINGSITLDESAGLQTGVPATATEDNNDSDISLATLQSGVSSFYDRLFGLGELNLSSSFATANGVARSASNYISLSGTGSVTSLGFFSSTGTALPVLGSGTGASTNLFALDGGAIELFIDPASELGNRVAYGVDQDGDIVFALYMEPAANLLSARVWMVQFEALDNTDATNHDDFLALAGLGVGAGVSTEFNFAGLPSGQNLFGMVGSTTSGLVVFAKTPVLNPDGTFTNASNTINTSQGGGATTIGVNNQMFDPGEGAYFTFVKGANPNFLALAPGGLDQNEADDADNIQYSDGNAATNDLIEVDGAFVRIAQIQGNALATMSIEAFNIAGSPQEEALIAARGTNHVNLNKVVVYNAAGVKIEDSSLPGAQDPNVTISFSGGIATVSGLGAGYRVEFFTSDPSVKFDQVLISGVAGKFDIGGFGVNEPTSVVAPLTGVRFEDDGPSVDLVLNGDADLILDETDDDADDDGPGGILATNSIATSAYLTTNSANFGTDGEAGTSPTVWSLSLTGANAAGVDSGLDDAITNSNVMLFVVDAQTIVGKVGGSGGVVVMTITIDATTGELTVVQNRAVEHNDSGDHDESTSPAMMNSGLVAAVRAITDGDDDTASDSVDVSQVIKLEDDGPDVELALNGDADLILDETDNDPDDNDVGGILAANSLAAAAYLTQDDAFFGSDGPAGANPTVWSLGLTGANVNGVDSGLDDAETNANVMLFVVDAQTIVGKVGGPAGALVMTITIDATTGELSVSQNRAVEHDDSGDHDESSSPAMMNSGLVAAVRTITDGDGDQDSDSVDISQVIKLEDDGPDVELTLNGDADLVLDETDNDLDDNNVGGILAANSLAPSAYLTQDDAFFGSDGPAGANPTIWSLDLTGADAAGVDSGLNDTLSGDDVLLFVVDAQTIVGKAGSSVGPVVMTITINATNGTLSVTQDRAVEHDNAADHDESTSPAMIDAGLIAAVRTITDGDGDQDSDSVDVSQVIKLEDDGPSIDIELKATASLTVDESSLALPTPVPAEASITAADLLDVVSQSFGSDGAGTVATAYKLVLGNTDSGLLDTETGQEVILSINAAGTVISGKVNDGGLVDVFTIAIDPDTGTVTLTQLRAMKHGDATDPDEADTPLTLEDGTVSVRRTITDGDDDSASDDVDISEIFKFKDDGPTQPDAGENVPPLVTDDSDITDDAAVSTAAIFPDAPSFGADGPRASNPIVFSLRLDDLAPGDGDAPDSGLVDTATGKAIRWVQPVAGGDIIGYVDLDGDGEIEAGDPEAVRYSLVAILGDPLNFNVTFTQTRAVFHAIADTEETILGNTVFVERKAFDGDGDPAEAVDFDLSEITALLDDEPAIGPIPNGLVDFVLNDFVNNDLEGIVGNDPKTNPYTLTAFTPSVVVNGVTVTGVAAADNQSVTYWANTNNNGTIGDAGDTAYFRLELGDQGGEGDYTFTVLLNPPPANLEFNFNALPSGQNLFGTVGDTASGLIVFGKTPVLNPDGTFTNASNTINTSQGGGPTTIGVNNQMFDPNDGAYFTFVKNPVADFLAGAPNGLTQGEADDADNMQYTGGTIETGSAFVKISQIQGNALATMKIEAFNITGSPQGQALVQGRGTGHVDVTKVIVYNAAGTKIEDSSLAGAQDPNVVITFSGGVATVTGLGAGYRIEWFTNGVHDQVLITGTGGKFDVGGFGINQAQPTPDQVLEFTARVTDGDGDFASASWKIGIDGTGIHDDNMVSGVII